MQSVPFEAPETQKTALLKQLLDAGEKQRHEMARAVHSAKSEVYYLKQLLDDLKNTGAKDQDKPQLIQQAIDSLINNMALLYETHLNNPAEKLGLAGRLRHCIQKLAEQFNGQIDFETNINKPGGKEPTWPLPCYKACALAIELVCLHGYRLVEIELNIVENGFNLSVKGARPQETDFAIKQAAITQTLNALKAHLIWKNARLSETSNWKDYIGLAFDTP